MARTAEYSIKGYLYQFLRYLSEILAAGPGTKITIEGAIEDVDVAAPGFTTAVQCKYHEAVDKFSLSKIYKPVLLMLQHFSHNSSATPEIRYRLFCHFPDQNGTRQLSKDELKSVLATKSEAMHKIIERIAPGVDHDVFLARFTIEFGQTSEGLQKSVLATLSAKGFSAEDVDAIIFPNAIQRIVDTATRSAITDRTVDPATFIEALRDVRRVTFTRWTRALASRAQIAKRLREDLAPSLAHNVRRRTFVINPGMIEKFDDTIVVFIKRFVERYCYKYLHEYPPLFLITGDYDVDALATRLHDAGLTAATGMVGSAFRANALFKKPMRRKTPLEIEFRLGLARRSVVTEDPPQRPDELFLVNVTDDVWAKKDVAVHRFEIERLSDLEYVLKLRKEYA